MFPPLMNTRFRREIAALTSIIVSAPIWICIAAFDTNRSRPTFFNCGIPAGWHWHCVILVLWAHYDESWRERLRLAGHRDTGNKILFLRNFKALPRVLRPFVCKIALEWFTTDNQGCKISNDLSCIHNKSWHMCDCLFDHLETLFEAAKAFLKKAHTPEQADWSIMNLILNELKLKTWKIFPQLAA